MLSIHPGKGRERPTSTSLVTPGWLAGHVLVWVGVAVCIALAWWQAGRAAEGNMLSYGYTLQWPLFAVFLVVIWVREIRRALGRDRKDETTTSDQPVRRQPVITRPVSQSTSGADGEADPQLVEYNRYLAWLNEHPGARPTDYPG